jgi:insulysin
MRENALHSVELVTDCLETPSLDDRTYRVVRLPNKLEALLVHDPQADKASAAMDVGVGSFSDEDDMPGMAHAVEHVRMLLVAPPSDEVHVEWLTVSLFADASCV